MESSTIESGLQFLARINVRPNFHNLDSILFPNNLPSNATIELGGNLSSGKILLLTQLIAKCILPVNHDGEFIGGLAVNVVLINTNYHFMVSKLRKFIISYLYKNKVSDLKPKTIDSIVKQSLDNLIIINCYDSSEFFLTIHTLDNILENYKNISLIAIDTITSYYWIDRQKNGEWLISRYIRNILKIVQKFTLQWNILFLYTKIKDPTHKDDIPCVDLSTLEKINFRINLHRNDEKNTYTCTAESHSQTNKIDYTIDSNGITWNK